MRDFLRDLGIQEVNSGVSDGRFIDAPSGPEIESLDPSTGRVIARVRTASGAEYDRVVDTACKSFADWRMLPAPERGQVVLDRRGG